MSAKQEVSQTEDLNKSIDALLDEVFSDSMEKGSPLDIAGDSKTTADAAVNQAPAMQNDKARGAGRPKEISDVPNNDQDGKRDGSYDASIASGQGEVEPDEAKKQAKAIDQCSSAGHMASASKAPRVAPFKKSDGTELTEEDFRAFENFQKSHKEAADKAAQESAKVEELQKAEKQKKDNEDLVKSAVAAATSRFAKENEELRKAFNETSALVKAMASQPMPSKSITNIQALEKSQRPEDKGEQTFSKAEILDAAVELVMKGQLPDVTVSEIEMTGRCHSPEARAKIEKFLSSTKS